TAAGDAPDLKKRPSMDGAHLRTPVRSRRPMKGSRNNLITRENDKSTLITPDSPTFAALGARPETVAALAEVGITRAFAIQEYAIPIALRGADLIGQAPTGTGKTLGFGVPLLQRVVSPD